MRKFFFIALALLMMGASTAAVAEQTTAERLVKLEQEIAVLKRQIALEKEVSEAAAAKAPNIEYGKKGLKIASKDGKNWLSIRGYAQFDNRSFISDDSQLGVDSNVVRRARPIIESQAGDFSFRLMPDFAGGTVRMFDAYADYKPYEEFALRVGKFKSPIGLEFLKSRTDDTFIETGLPTSLVSGRDVGLMAYGTLIPEIEYQAGIFNGNADGVQDESDLDDNKDMIARVFVQPFKRTDTVLKGLGLGVGGSIGDRDGSTSVRQLGTYKTPGQATFFQYSSSTFSQGETWRVAPQAYYYFGPFGALGEYTLTSQEVKNGSTVRTLENDAWQVQLSYVLTGEDATYKSVTPDEPLDPAKGTWGAWEIAGRAGELDIDDAAFPLFASTTASASEARNWGGALNGYLNDNVKITLDYERTEFDGGAAGGVDRDTEELVASRLGVRF